MSFRISFGMARARQVGLGLSVVLLSALVAGCGSSSGNVVAFGTAPVPPAMQHPRLEGFPIPPGFALVDEKSFVEKSGDIRHAHCEFRGGLSIADVDRFYRQRMPEAGFTLRNERLDQGEYLLNYESPRESSTVSFKENHRKTILLITLNPTSGGPPAVRPQPKPKTQP
jgi:hypothetical protein